MTKNILEENLSTYKPGLHAILDYGKSCGLEGEEATLMAGSIAFHGADLCILVGGASQAGKTHLSEIVMSQVVPSTDTPHDIVNDRERLLDQGGILQLEFGSKTAMAYNEKKLGVADGLYVPEYQKLIDAGASNLALEALKSFGEGRDAYRDVTNVHKGNTQEQKMKRSNFWTNLATENPLKLDIETGNRVLPLFVDVSAEQTKRIMLHKAKKEFVAGRQLKMMPEETLAFKHFMKKYRTTRELIFENPFAEYITSQYLPSKYIKSRRAIDFYLSFNRAICKWHYLNNNRMDIDGHILLNIEDIYQTEEIYGLRCRFDMLQLDPNSMEIFNVFQKYQGPNVDKKKLQFNDDGRVMMDISTIHKELSSSGGINLKINIVEQMLDELQECGYLEYTTGTKQKGCRYMLVDTDKPVQSLIDYQSVFNHGAEMIKEWIPDAYEEWVTKQIYQGKMIVSNPFTGAHVNLLDSIKSEAPVQRSEKLNPQPKKSTLDVKWS